MAHLYRDGGSAINPVFSVHHLNADSSRVDFRIDRQELLYMKGSDEADFGARLAIAYRLQGSRGQMIDSGRVFLFDRKQLEATGHLKSSFYIQRSDSISARRLKLIFYDLNRKYRVAYERTVTDALPGSRQYFEWRSLSGELKFTPWANREEAYRIRYLPKDTLLFVRFYQRDFPIATPPYASVEEESFDFNEDSLFMVSTYDTLQFTTPGIYHFQLDTSSTEGFTIFQFEKGFPRVLNRVQLAPPLRYITTRKEYERLTGPDDNDSLKYVADRFWLKAAGSIERGQEIIADYYGRVEKANANFTSYLEGWKTDRGIIYIIYGPPSEVYRDVKGETWIYGDRNSQLSYIFNFVKVPNPFTENDFALDRRTEYRYGWGQAVGAWRSGRNYGVKDSRREQNARDAQLRQQRTSPVIWY